MARNMEMHPNKRAGLDANSMEKSFDAENGVESVINSTDAIDMVSHGSELTINVTTPVGTRYMGKTRFIGTHSDNFILLEAPDISGDDFTFFFQEGFWMNVRAISQKGEGAIIQFRSQVMHVLTEPIPLAMITIPGMMKIKQLRKEPRYDVNLKAYVAIGDNKLECEVRDISKGGCRFTVNPLARHFNVGDEAAIAINVPSFKNKLAPITGTVCNLQSSVHYAKYGLKFDDAGQVSAKQLLACLKFDGTKLALKG